MQIKDASVLLVLVQRVRNIICTISIFTVIIFIYATSVYIIIVLDTYANSADSLWYSYSLALR